MVWCSLPLVMQKVYTFAALLWRNEVRFNRQPSSRGGEIETIELELKREMRTIEFERDENYQARKR